MPTRHAARPHRERMLSVTDHRTPRSQLGYSRQQVRLPTIASDRAPKVLEAELRDYLVELMPLNTRRHISAGLSRRGTYDEHTRTGGAHGTATYRRSDAALTMPAGATRCRRASGRSQSPLSGRVVGGSGRAGRSGAVQKCGGPS